jgi:hypothetical protein
VLSLFDQKFTKGKSVNECRIDVCKLARLAEKHGGNRRGLICIKPVWLRGDPAGIIVADGKDKVWGEELCDCSF